MELKNPSSKAVKKFSSKVEKAWENYEQVQKIKRQMSKLMPNFDLEKEINSIKTEKIDEDQTLSENDDRLKKMKENILIKYRKMIKQRPLDHAVLYLIQHSELMTDDPISTERLLLC